VWTDARTLSFLANLLSAAAALALAAAGVTWLARQPMFTLTRIELLAAPPVGTSTRVAASTPSLRYVSPASVRTAIAGQLTGNFFTVDLNQARQAFESAPWVRRASVHRVWPNALQVTLEEEQPLAYWNDGQLLNVWGEAFTANLGELEDEPLMPRLVGPPGSETLVAQRYAQLMHGFAPLAIVIQRLELTPRYAWQASLSNGMTLELGRDPQADSPQTDTPRTDSAQADASDFSTRINRFVQAWPEVLQALAGREVTHADLRHDYGFALTLVETPKPTGRTQPRTR